jgi:hypothetical protein
MGSQQGQISEQENHVRFRVPIPVCTQSGPLRRDQIRAFGLVDNHVGPATRDQWRQLVLVRADHHGHVWNSGASQGLYLPLKHGKAFDAEGRLGAVTHATALASRQDGRSHLG